MASVDEVRAQALNLSVAERSILVRDLIESIEGSEPESQAEQAWIDEIEHRCDAYDRGELPASDLKESLERTRQQIEQGRSK